MNEEVLMHHGIKGQKWGVRRFQNADGSLTVAGRKRYVSDEQGNSKNIGQKGLSNKQKNALKTVGKAALIVGTVAAAGYLYSNNAEAINSTISKMSSKTVQSVANSAVKGHKYVQSLARESMQGVKDGVKQAPQKAKEGITEGIGNATKNVVKVAAEGAAILAAKKFLESTISSKEDMAAYTQAYNAYNKKKKVGKTGKNEDDDDD